MIYESTRLIHKYFKEEGLEAFITEAEDFSVVNVPVEIPGGPALLIRFISDVIERRIALQACVVVCIPDEKKAAVLALCNELNDEFHCLKFYVSKYSHLNLECDIPELIPDNILGLICFRRFLLARDTILKNYMRFHWIIHSPCNEKASLEDLLRELISLNRTQIVIESDEVPDRATLENWAERIAKHCGDEFPDDDEYDYDEEGEDDFDFFKN